jgi:hypothetical protein
MEGKVKKGKTETVEIETRRTPGRPLKNPSKPTTTPLPPTVDAKGTTTTIEITEQKVGNTITRTTKKVVQTASSQKAEAALEKVNAQLAKNKNALATKHTLGKRLQDFGGFIANAGTLLWLLIDEDVRVGLAGIALLGGFFFINLMFAFILIEQMLILGVALILFPFLAVCWCFDVTKSYAQTSFGKLFGFAVGLIFLCLLTVVCIELDNWILGGMLRNESGSLTSVRDAIKIVYECNNGGDCNIESLASLTGTHWYFLYILFAVYLNAKLLGQAPKFAGWFKGNIGESAIGNNLKSFGKSAVGYVASGSRKFVGMIKNKDKEKKVDAFDRIGALVGRVGGLFKRKEP